MSDSLDRSDAALSLAVVGTIADSYLVEVLRRFQERHGAVRVDLQTANSREVSGLVRRGAAAVGLRYFPDADARLESVALGAERLYVVVPTDHRVASSRRKDLKAFAADRWLGFPEQRRQPESYGSQLKRQLEAGGLENAQITTVDSLTAQKRLVEAGFGVALMPKRNVRDELRAGTLRLVEVGSVTARLPVALVRRKRGVRSAPETALTELLRERIPELLDS